MSERMTALLDELAGTWEVMAEMEQASKEGRRETLRECSDGLRMLADIVRKTDSLAVRAKTDRVAVLEELLRSACAIAERQGAGTAWDRFAASVHAVGLNAVTARTYRVLPSDEPAPQAEPQTCSICGATEWPCGEIDCPGRYSKPLNAAPQAEPAAAAAPQERKCVITLYGIKVDVVALYRKRGFEVLPTTLTMSAWDLRSYGRVPNAYSLVRSTDLTAEPIGDAESVPVQDGDEFIAVPPAYMRGAPPTEPADSKEAS